MQSCIFSIKLNIFKKKNLIFLFQFKKEYTGEESNFQKCIYHEGIPIFHEGMKYWSCCQRKTSDFDNFLNQVGCCEGKHLWFKEKVNKYLLF
jgi:hypothetical protein